MGGGIFTCLAQREARYQPPAGWAIRQIGEDTEMTPGDLPPNERYSFTVRPPQELAGQSLRSWLAAQIRQETHPGKQTSDNGISQQQGFLASTRIYQIGGGMGASVFILRK